MSTDRDQVRVACNDLKVILNNLKRATDILAEAIQLIESCSHYECSCSQMANNYLEAMNVILGDKNEH